ncbi:MAG: hypothetical protein TR69_WS6001000125 [candidate division WS6 bacterium OLB20]|uniref:Uncharacterized protein n=1 Tax=candidate division WS6 bacterium OLB20 TaxID=1617426 RepID=A0A136M040_9BACT|nr:MAG: hypothetical protein TR69_WS6001000125 [candidate division WS6 bacterium OLB20]
MSNKDTDQQELPDSPVTGHPGFTGTLAYLRHYEDYSSRPAVSTTRSGRDIAYYAAVAEFRRERGVTPPEISDPELSGAIGSIDDWWGTDEYVTASEIADTYMTELPHENARPDLLFELARKGFEDPLFLPVFTVRT